MNRKQEEDEQQKQREQQAVQPAYIIVPTGYCDYPIGGKHHPDETAAKTSSCNKLNPKPCPINK